MNQTKECGTCHQVKSVTEFAWNDASHTTRRYRCKDCDKQYLRELYASNPDMRKRISEKSTQWAKDHPAQNKIHRRRADLKTKYGMTQDDYERLLAAQGGKCALCGTDQIGRYGKNAKWKSGHWQVDHCHRTGRVRGLLCHQCNVRIGAFEGLMEKAGEAKVNAYLGNGTDYFKLNGIDPTKRRPKRKHVEDS